MTRNCKIYFAQSEILGKEMVENLTSRFPETLSLRLLLPVWHFSYSCFTSNLHYYTYSIASESLIFKSIGISRLKGFIFATIINSGSPSSRFSILKPNTSVCILRITSSRKPFIQASVRLKQNLKKNWNQFFG